MINKSSERPFCLVCGAYLEEGAESCSICGTPISEMAQKYAELSEPSPIPSDESSADTNAEKESKPITVCASCGEPLDNDAAFCAVCGGTKSVLSFAPKSVVKEDPKPVKRPKRVPFSKEMKKRIACLIFSILMLVSAFIPFKISEYRMLIETESDVKLSISECAYLFFCTLQDKSDITKTNGYKQYVNAASELSQVHQGKADSMAVHNQYLKIQKYLLYAYLQTDDYKLNVPMVIAFVFSASYIICAILLVLLSILNFRQSCAGFLSKLNVTKITVTLVSVMTVSIVSAFASVIIAYGNHISGSFSYAQPHMPIASLVIFALLIFVLFRITLSVRKDNISKPILIHRAVNVILCTVVILASVLPILSVTIRWTPGYFGDDSYLVPEGTDENGEPMKDSIPDELSRAYSCYEITASSSLSKKDYRSLQDSIGSYIGRLYPTAHTNRVVFDRYLSQYVTAAFLAKGKSVLIPDSLATLSALSLAVASFMMFLNMMMTARGIEISSKVFTVSKIILVFFAMLLLVAVLYFIAVIAASPATKYFCISLISPSYGIFIMLACAVAAALHPLGIKKKKAFSVPENIN